MCLPRPADAYQRMPAQSMDRGVGYDPCVQYQLGWDIKDPTRGSTIPQYILAGELKLELEVLTTEHGHGLILG